MKKHFADRGVSFVGVCASEAETPASVAKRATDFALAFPVYSDCQGLAVSAFKAEKTPEAFLLDHNLVLRYRGRVDDAFAARLKRNHPELYDALRSFYRQDPAGDGKPSGRLKP